MAASGIVFGLSVVSLPALPPAFGIATVLVGIAASFFYVRHSRRRSNPLLNLKLFANPVFRTAVVGGSIFRVGIGAVPFLLPLLFQLGFGLSPFQSGMLTFASAIGAFAMKFLAPMTLRLGGFRTILIASGLLSSFLIAVNAFFTATTSPWLIIAVLLIAGFVRSLFFTATNALTFADIEAGDVSQATAIGAVAQQISIALGVAVGGSALEAAAYVSGQPIGTAAFTAAFLLVAAIALLVSGSIPGPCPDRRQFGFRAPAACPGRAYAAALIKCRASESCPRSRADWRRAQSIPKRVRPAGR